MCVCVCVFMYVYVSIYLFIFQLCNVKIRPYLMAATQYLFTGNLGKTSTLLVQMDMRHLEALTMLHHALPIESGQ